MKIYHDLDGVDADVDRRAVEEIVVARTVEDVDDRTKRRGVLALSLVGETIRVDFGTGTAVQVGHLQDQTGWFQQHGDEEIELELLHLDAGYLDAGGTVARHTARVGDETQVRLRIALEGSAGQESEMINNPVGRLDVVERLHQVGEGRGGVVDVVGDGFQQVERVFHHALEQGEIDAADRLDEVVQPLESGQLRVDQGFIATVGERLKVAEADSCARV